MNKKIHIDPEKCTGCGQCVNACPSGALALVDGKARLVNEHHCDQLGVCIGECPFGAIRFETETADSDPPAMECGGGCPGHQNVVFMDNRKKARPANRMEPRATATPQSALEAWPIQLHLIHPGAPQFQGRDVLIAASCTAFSTGAFHTHLLSGKALIIACPKLDDRGGYLEKLTALFRDASPSSVTIARMGVPCCQGLTELVLEARRRSGSSLPVKEIVVSIDGEFLGEMEFPAMMSCEL